MNRRNRNPNLTGNEVTFLLALMSTSCEVARKAALTHTAGMTEAQLEELEATLTASLLTSEAAA